MIKIPIEVGDIVRVGRFKNKRVKVKSIEYDENGLPIINGRPLLTMRIEKLMKPKTLSEGQGKKLFIIDFDDTLAKVKATIYARNGAKEFTLTPAEFAVYDTKPGDVFNFREFNTIIKTAAPIKPNIDLLAKAASNYGTKTTILTARQLAYPVKRYLKKTHNLDVYVVALGDGNPQRKADYIEKEIKKGYNDITFIDDSAKNIQAVEKLKSKYPNVSIKLIHTTEAEHIKF
jgi:co-chaperonin GroES (HSP10)